MLLSLPAQLIRVTYHNLMNITKTVHNTIYRFPVFNSKQKAAAIAIPVLMLLCSCGNKEQKNNAVGFRGIGTYRVLTLQPRSAALNTDYPASIQGLQNIEIRPKVDGFVEKIYVDEGSLVKKAGNCFLK